MFINAKGDISEKSGQTSTEEGECKTKDGITIQWATPEVAPMKRRVHPPTEHETPQMAVQEKPYKPLHKEDMFNPPTFASLAADIAKVVEEKQAAYGDSFGKSGLILKILYPDGIKVDQYDDMLCIVRIVDKLFRVATDKDAFGESPYRDLAGYSLLGVMRDKVEKFRSDKKY